MHGLLLIDKPSGLTSHDIVRRVRRLFKTRRVGHAGTLDPLASGVLPVALGEATRLLQFLLADDKAYRATARLGVTTDTLDADGEILEERPVPEISQGQLERVLQCFRGAIEQIPPMYSALKQNGVPLYKLARQGETVERQPRRVTIHSLKLLSFAPPFLQLEVHCSKGTYIRSLLADIGEELGCGAHLTALRRTASAGFEAAECIALADLENLDDPHQALLTPLQAMRAYPVVELNADAVKALHFGIPPQAAEATSQFAGEDGATVCLAAADQLLAMARYAPRREREKRGDFELLKVFVRA